MTWIAVTFVQTPGGIIIQKLSSSWAGNFFLSVQKIISVDLSPSHFLHSQTIRAHRSQELRVMGLLLLTQVFTGFHSQSVNVT